MDNMPIEKQNSEEIDFNKELKSFEEIFFDTNVIPNSRYRLVENTEEAKSGHCNGILNEYEVEILRKSLLYVDSASSSEDLDLSVNAETVYKKDIEDPDLEGIPFKRLIFNIGGNTFRSKSDEDFPSEQGIQTLLLTVMGIVERRVKNTTLIEFRIV